MFLCGQRRCHAAATVSQAHVRPPNSHSRNVMLRRPFVLAACLLCLGARQRALAQDDKRIPLADLEAMFSNMRRKTKWNVDGPLLWGYFFIDPSRERLNRLAARLEDEGYRLVEVRRVVESAVLHQLHVERVEVHSPSSLFARNAELYKLAAELGVQSYDGMDVGPVLPPGR